jgi:hypothetical protein
MHSIFVLVLARLPVEDQDPNRNTRVVIIMKMLDYPAVRRPRERGCGVHRYGCVGNGPEKARDGGECAGVAAAGRQR